MKKDKIIALILAVISIIFGILTIIFKASFYDRCMRLIAIMILVDGIYEIVMYSRKENYLNLSSLIVLASSITAIVCGLNLFIYPGSNITVFTIVLPLWSLAHQIANLSQHISDRSFRYRLASLIDIIAIILSLVTMSRLTFVGIDTLIAILFILLGFEIILTSM